MPRIDFSDIPSEIRRHLMKRIRQRGRVVDVDILIEIRRWVETSPEAPDGDWYKDFGAFFLVGHGAYPKTILDKNKVPYGKQIL